MVVDRKALIASFTIHAMVLLMVVFFKLPTPPLEPPPVLTAQLITLPSDSGKIHSKNTKAPVSDAPAAPKTPTKKT
ncbi:MAG: hypothetical protein HQL51_12085, partial [Magnetococcales bacterium]|nr:hypothetical protein [Magnetococcales bacterium]